MFQDTVVTKAITVSSLSSRSLSRLNAQGSVQLQPGEPAWQVPSSSMLYICCPSAWDTFT